MSDFSPGSALPVEGLERALADAQLGTRARVVSGPSDVGAEQCWSLELEDGRRAVVGRLSLELAKELPVRRRYVRDLERLRALESPALAPIVAIGPQPDPRDPSAAAPWRLRLDPEGESMAEWLERFAPAPLDVVAQRVAALADAVHALHTQGAVLREVDPRCAMWTGERIVLTDVGLARVESLSSLTASSVLVHGSAYAAPEQLVKTRIDTRADVFGIGVIAWRAITGTFPYGDEPAFLRETRPLPDLRALRADAPRGLAVLLARCLAEDPDERPESVSEIAWVMRGGQPVEGRPEMTSCQHCGAPLRVGQRLCLGCGRVGVRFEYANRGKGRGIELRSIDEDVEKRRRLWELIEAVNDGPVRRREFLVGPASTYTEEERAAYDRVPARLFNHVDPTSAAEILERMREAGLDVAEIDPQWVKRRARQTALFFGVASLLTFAAGIITYGEAAVVVPMAIVGLVGTLIFASRMTTAMADHNRPALFRLRPKPAALPASDPLVARLASLLEREPEGELRTLIGELALLVQRVVDRRAELGLAEREELEMLTAPLEPLVDQLEAHARRVAEIDADLRPLDEGRLLRDLARARAREQPEREEAALADLDRMRGLEDERSRAMQRLLEAASLMRRSVDLGLAVQDPAAEYERHVQLARAALDESS